MRFTSFPNILRSQFCIRNCGFYIVPFCCQETEPHVDHLPQLKLETPTPSGLDSFMDKLQSH